MTETLATLRRQRGQLKRKLTDFNTFLQDFKTKQDLSLTDIKQLEERIERIYPLLDHLDNIHNKICELPETFEEDNVYVSEFESFYFAVVSEAKTLFQSKTHVNPEACHVGSVDSSSKVNNSNLLNCVKLPTISLPKFNGQYNKWLEFHDTFCSLIESNETLSNVQKFHYLRASLEGDASDVINSLHMSASNYAIAWKLLCDRYTNKKLLIQNHLGELFRLKPIIRESASVLREMSDTITKNLRALETLGQPIKHWDSIIVYLASSKLDRQTARDWELYKLSGDLPTLYEFQAFLASRADMLENIKMCQGEGRQQKEFKSTKINKTFVTSNVSCYYCKGLHAIYTCDKFLKLSVQDRINEVNKLNLCTNCLGQHGDKQCYLRSRRCKRCKQPHNTLLHVSTPIAKESHASSSGEVVQQVNLNACVANRSCQVLLATALVKLKDKDGNWQICRALLDSASQSNFITADLQRKLGIKVSEINISIQGINQVVSPIHLQCETIIKSNAGSFSMNLQCLVMDKISNNLPHFCFDQKYFQLPENLHLADPTFNVPGTIDLLIGAQVFWSLILRGQVKLGKDLPVLQNTRLGWILSGPFSVTCNNQSPQCLLTQNTDIQKQLQNFWQLEECPSSKPFSLEEQKCESLFKNSICKDSTGRFIVTIPLKDSPEILGDSRSSALKRFNNLEKRFQSKPAFKESYVRFMDEYIKFGHMSLIEHPDDSKPHFYMPHHGVINEASRTTKLRVVFDGSSRSSTGISFNDIQMIGPILQSDLFTILVRFRQHKIAFSVDVQKMYRQILVKREHTCFQRILWRDDPSQPLSTFELNTVTYGTASAPYLATRCLIQIADENASQYPEASEVIKSDSYVDDILSGASTVEEATSLCSQISNILGQAHFALHKWVSNDPEVLRDILDVSSDSDIIPVSSDSMTKTLGLFWQPSQDTLNYKVSCSREDGTITKRKILSEISQTFDPLGLLSASTIIGKIILQSLWMTTLDWDDPVPSSIIDKWNEFRKNLPIFNEIKIPRHILCNDTILIELHGFADASETAYCACIYLKCTSSSGSVQVTLICSRAKVAPLKRLTIPRLELCGAHLLSRLVKKVKDSLRVTINKVYLWSDSTIVLGWINSSPNMLKVFVGHRVADIQINSDGCDWRHVPTSDNPADLGSRGILPQQLKDSLLWWHGPTWLSMSHRFWPCQTVLNNNTEILPELRRTEIALPALVNESPIQFLRFSNFNRLVRCNAYVFRFINSCRQRHESRCIGPLSAQEINNSLLCLIKIVQSECFSQELQCLRSNTALPSKSKIANLNPFIDNGIIRVGGRIDASNLNFEQKHPIVLPKHHFTMLLFRNQHQVLMHAGPQMLLSSIRDNYWPLKGRNYARFVVHSCVKCFRCKPVNEIPKMGNLPADRVTQAMPFENVGIDYAGPLLIKLKPGRGVKTTKCYVCIFVCFATKAVHIELVTDLSTDSFLSALKRFIARRGKPKKIYSDNGSNFVGAWNELRKIIDHLKSSNDKILDFLSNDGIVWSFIPPNSPHFGGLWEAGVKRVKFHLRRVMGNSVLTFDQLYTLLSQIESILNSRPLTPLSTDPNDLQPLTPSHFLIGRKSTSLPEDNFMHVASNRLSDYQQVQQLRQAFWKRWHQEYLQTLQPRKQWLHSVPNIGRGTMVLLKLDSEPPLHWPLGRVTESNPGPDGVVRVVKVKTQRGEYTRPVTKVYPLPINEGNNQI